MNTTRPILWLRDEPKRGERRAALTPAAVTALLSAGFPVTVERSNARAFADAEYVATGASMVESGDWRSAPEQTVIIGLKELDASLGPFTRRHVHFAHVFKRQQGWRSVLRAFDEGAGQLFDLEYLVDEHGRRVAAFGYWAGYVGAALGLLALAAPAGGLAGPLVAWADRDALLRDVRAACTTLRGSTTSGGSDAASTTAMVFGALGRSGRGASDLLRTVGIEPSCWDREQTAAGGPFDEVLQHELIVNCVFVAEPVPPLTTHDHLARPQRRTRVIVDVSCDPFGEANVLPIYTRPTSLDEPSARLIEGDEDRNGPGRSLDLVAIDHLPALLPRESSEDFSAALLPTLLTLDDERSFSKGPFGRALAVFDRERAAAREPQR